MLDDATPGPDLKSYLEAPLRRPRLVAAIFAVAVLLSTAWSFSLAELYRSSTLILLEAEAAPDALVRRVADTAKSQFQTVRQQILSRTRLERVIEELDPYPEMKATASLAKMVDTMRATIGINIKGNDAFTIEFVHTKPEKARDVAHRLATLFIEEVGDARSEHVADAAAFMGTELGLARQSLEAQEAAIRRFKERNMGRLPEQVSANLATLQRLQVDSKALDEPIRQAADRLAALEKNLDKSVSVGGAGTSSELTQLRSQLAALRERYTEDHPDVRQLTARVQNLERQRTATTPAATLTPSDPELEKARQNLETLASQRRVIEERITIWQDRVEQAPRVEQELTILTRDHTTLRENYLALLNRKMETERAKSLEQLGKGRQFRILDPASLPDRPFFPKRSLFLLGGVLAGLVLGIGFAAVAEYLDLSVKSPRELESLMPFPVLVTLPHVRAGRESGERGTATGKRSG